MDSAMSPDNFSYSVAMCTYNGAAYVGDQLRSILAQSTPPSQIVVADDGSTDGTVAIVNAVFDDWNRTHPPIDVVVVDQRLGRGVARNFERALKLCTADYVAIADQDDLWTSSRISAAVALFAERPDTVLVASNALLVDSTGVTQHRTQFSELAVSTGEIEELNGPAAYRSQLRRNVLPGMAFLVRRQFVTAALPIPDGWMHDEWLATLAACQGCLRVSEQSLVEYRQHDSNVIGAGRRTLLVKIGKVFSGTLDGAITSLKYEALLAQVEPRALNGEVARAIQQKYAFELRRSALPRFRLARIVPVARLLGAKQYALFASNGNLNAIRDLAQTKPGRPSPRVEDKRA
jgi:glycosyltransferase involved in cell wall biosynthesis